MKAWGRSCRGGVGHGWGGVGCYAGWDRSYRGGVASENFH